MKVLHSQEAFTKYLLCAKPCSKCWGCSREQRQRMLELSWAYIVVQKTTKKTDNFRL